MPRLRRLTARQVLRALGGFGFDIVATHGSHAKLVRCLPDGERQVLTVPIHKHLAVGTLRAIVRQAARFVPSRDLQREFFTD